MRPLKLKIKAFGSYIQPVTLDFEKNLSDRKIFLIHGATGAGKTTILDAICYALYGEGSGDERNGYMMRSKGIPDNALTLVEFTFALGEKIYTVSREMSYHPRRKVNQLQVVAQLTCDGKLVESKSVAVTDKIKSLLGFAPAQFRQVVLLPQGEFKNFLSANADERQPVLDALFDAEFYKRIETGLKLRAETCKIEFDKLNHEREILISQLQDANLDASMLENLNAEYEAAQKKSAALKSVLDSVNRDFAEGRILSANFNDLANRRKNLTTARNDLAQAEKLFTAAKNEYDLHAGEQSRRENLRSTVDELMRVKKSLIELDACRKSLADAEKTHETEKRAQKKLEDEVSRYSARLDKLKTRREELSGADKVFAEAKATLDRANEREKILQDIARLERELAAGKLQIASAEERFNAADLQCKRLEKLQRDGSAARLAKNLRDGEPCPVCGSRVHPHVDFSEVIIPTDAEIDAAKSAAEREKKFLDGKKASASSIEGQLIAKRDELKKFSDVPPIDDVQNSYAAAKKHAEELADCIGRVDKGERIVAERKDALTAVTDREQAASRERERIFGTLQTLEGQVDKKYRDDGRQLDSDLAATVKILSELEDAHKRAEKNFRAAMEKKSSCAGLFTAAQKSERELAEKLAGKTQPDMNALVARVREAQKNHTDANREETLLDAQLKRLKNDSARIIELEKQISAAEKELRIWSRLSDAASGKIIGKKLSFARYYLSAMFEQVLTEANYRLAKMSDRRYSLKSKTAGTTRAAKAGLNLEILDDYTGETRPVATLSGGESFLASLSLALGLAAVVRNNAGGIKLDTIFIDEGFGTLDAETLDFALKTLIELQNDGRLVGIISHVEELKKQIPVRLEVTKSKTGSKAEFKHGLSRD